MEGQITFFTENANYQTVNSDAVPASDDRKSVHIRNDLRSYKGQQKATIPIEDYEDMLAMANWLYENKHKKYVLAFVIGINVGLRGNELLSLRMNQVFNPDGTVRKIDSVKNMDDAIYVNQTKVRQKQPIFMNDACEHALNWYFAPGKWRYCDRPVFPSRKHGDDGKIQPISVDMLRKTLKEAAVVCGLGKRVGSHTMRKTYATYLFDKVDDDGIPSGFSGNITAVSICLGHKSINTTRRYIGTPEKIIKKCSRLLALDIIADPRFIGNACDKP